jgi:hypothetical protein
MDNNTTTVTADQSRVGRWARVTGIISKDKKVKLYVNEKLVGEKPLTRFLARDPNDSMQIGADRGSQVTKYPEPAGFVGMIESVSLFDGEKP